MIDGFRYFGYVPPGGMTDAEMARRHTEVFLERLLGKGIQELLLGSKDAATVSADLDTGVKTWFTPVA